MRLLKLTAFMLVCAALAFAQADNKQQLKEGFDIQALDRSVEPCVDFYKFACGGWKKNNPLPGDKARYGRFDELQERNNAILKDILEKAATPSANRTKAEAQIGDFYAACMDEAKAEQLGAKPIESDLKKIAKAKTKADLLKVIAELSRIGAAAPFGFGPAPDMHKAEMMMANVFQGGYALPDRDYYVKDDARSSDVRAKYVEHVQKMFELLGEKPAQAAKDAKTVMAIETELARANMDRTLMRDPKNRDHKMALKEFLALAPSIDFDTYFTIVGAPKFDSVNVVPPDYFKTLEKQWTSVSLEDWKTYTRWRVLRAAASLLSKPFFDENFSFNQKYMNGQKQPEVRWKRCVNATNAALGEAVGQLYVEKTFGTEGKKRTLEMVINIEKAMGQNIGTLDWMTDDTKKASRVKLDAVRNNIGYPDKWRDYSSIKVKRNDLLGNVRRASEFEVARVMKKIGNPADRTEWSMTPPTVNAYYRPAMNDINFPAGILQPPFFERTMDEAVNYGAIGAVMGHELTHGFDDQGSKFAADGNFKNWWTETDRAEFDKRTQCIVDQYAGYSPVEGVNLNGKLTLGENVSDNGGVRLAYLALQNRLREKPQPAIDGFTPEQRFFLGYAQIWCQNVSPERARQLAIVDPHSPGEFRVNGVVVNSPDFSKAFGCKQGQPMVAENACRVW